MKVVRYAENPLVQPSDIEPHLEQSEVIGAFNAGTAKLRNETILLLRVAERPVSSDNEHVSAVWYDPDAQGLRTLEFNLNDEALDFRDSRVIRYKNKSQWSYLTSVSYLRVARSTDGRHFIVDKEPLLFPNNRYEAFGVEDPRITQIEGRFYITYSVVSTEGVGVGLAETEDFVTVRRHGLIFPPENKDVVLFPERVNGKFFALHRPVPSGVGQPEVWIAQSDNLEHWGNHQHLIGLREGRWDSRRMGAGAVPIKTDKGWLEIYHGADHNDRYCMGALLLDVNNPAKVIARSDEPILTPTEPYETEGFFGNVVFSCGAVVEDDVVKLYYGVADTAMACAQFSLREILDSLTYVEPGAE
ncbi:glycoside hydrolase family 130 protein [Alicyclobacillus sp. SO9]|uniref:BtaManbiosPhlase n=1 Tax=Alicyclobacillus sp. SO9 TaxID=2665646 RepID=UPI0018E7E167|nr:glycoside hydrolase family 130 protein [Alicyclobacillus sp. SO9]QQE77734.1 glycoside hydrolase family 130 protein [Alicyclobacillus sp. SO9]